MPALKNARHERFVQELAKGASQVDAYRTAGYGGTDAAARANASRLIANDIVAARLAELSERAAVRTEITVASITERLLKIAEKGEKSSDAPLLSVARASLMDAAKLNGLVVDRTDLTVALTPEQRRQRIEALEARRRELLGDDRGRAADAPGVGALRH